jgi:hypothetical protein
VALQSLCTRETASEFIAKESAINGFRSTEGTEVVVTPEFEYIEIARGVMRVLR